MVLHCFLESAKMVFMATLPFNPYKKQFPGASYTGEALAECALGGHSAMNYYTPDSAAFQPRNVKTNEVHMARGLRAVSL